jgi:ribosomal protein S18 acetylase RimI-like enzyme
MTGNHRVTKFATKQLSKRTWSDFERLLETHPAPGAYPCWCMHNHRSGWEKKSTSRAIWIQRNHSDKRALVGQGRSHGILVYSHGEPVGWCQYGLMKELPRIDNNPKYRKLASASDRTLWRITCFVVHKKYRRLGVARAALKAALAAIQKQGGGLVEGYPIKCWGAYAEYRGTVSMFEKEGFQIVASLGESNVLMRRML